LQGHEPANGFGLRLRNGAAEFLGAGLLLFKIETTVVVAQN
jgi:hypothetical protein